MSSFTERLETIKTMINDLVRDIQKFEDLRAIVQKDLNELLVSESGNKYKGATEWWINEINRSDLAFSELESAQKYCEITRSTIEYGNQSKELFNIIQKSVSKLVSLECKDPRMTGLLAIVNGKCPSEFLSKEGIHTLEMAILECDRLVDFQNNQKPKDEELAKKEACKDIANNLISKLRSLILELERNGCNLPHLEILKTTLDVNTKLPFAEASLTDLQDGNQALQEAIDLGVTINNLFQYFFQNNIEKEKLRKKAEKERETNKKSHRETDNASGCNQQ